MIPPVGLNYNFFMSIVDQYRDPTFAVLINLTKDRPAIEELVKEAEIDEQELDTLPETAFAWPEKRAFPIHSREHTIMSRVYLENVQAVPKHVDQAIKEACEVYGVDDAVFARPKLAAVVDNPDDYLLPDLKRISVRSASQVKRAESILLDGYKKLAFENRAQACRRLMDKAAEYDVTLHPLILKLAGFTISSTEQLRSWLEARQHVAKEAVHKVAYQKLADALRGRPPESRDREELIKVAEVIGELDRAAGLEKEYDRTLPDPIQTVFNTEKIAAQGVDLGGKFVPLTRLASYDASFYGDVLGDDLVREASDGHGGVDPHKLATILETLPRDMKIMLAKQMRA
jgi:hypothetical protein